MMPCEGEQNGRRKINDKNKKPQDIYELKFFLYNTVGNPKNTKYY